MKPNITEGAILPWGLGSNGTENSVKHPHRWDFVMAATLLV